MIRFECPSCGVPASAPEACAGHASTVVLQGLTVLSVRDPVEENREAARRVFNKLSGKS